MNEFACETGFDMVDAGVALNADAIIGAIRSDLRDRLAVVDVVEETGSTNDDLLRTTDIDLDSRVLLAELQTAGKGRRGRSWHSAHGNISMSIGWRFSCATTSLGPLGLAVGVCVCRALERAGLRGHGVKWPNDIVIDGAKLGGILVETRQRRNGVDAVIGIGLNLTLDDDAGSKIEQPWTALPRGKEPQGIDRNGLVALILEEVLGILDRTGGGLAAFLACHWEDWDSLRGHRIRVHREDENFEGKACGITKDGALKLSTSTPETINQPEGWLTFHSGEVSVRHA